MKNLGLIGSCILLFGLYLAFFAHSSVWYSFFLIGGFLLLESINSIRGFSVLKNQKKFVYTWLIFIIVTVLTELIGKLWLNAWEYPHFGIFGYFIHVILIGYPFTGFLGLEFFVFIKRNSSIKFHWITLPISAFIFGYLNEFPNTFAYEWKYVNMIWGNFLNIPIIISILWLLLLFAQLFEKPFIFNNNNSKI